MFLVLCFWLRFFLFSCTLLRLLILAVLEHAEVARFANTTRVQIAVSMFALRRQLKSALTVVAIATKALCVILSIGMLAISNLTALLFVFLNCRLI